MTADVTKLANGASNEVNYLAGLAASTTTQLASGAESTLNTPLSFHKINTAIVPCILASLVVLLDICYLPLNCKKITINLI